jgi:AcrR family transcriptional regulator
MSPSGKSGDAYHHGDLRRALVEAATAIVAEDQNWEFSLREVARRAGVSHNAPYRHFPEKLDLLAAVAAEGFDSLRLAMIEAAEGPKSPDDALVAIGSAYVRFGTENPARYRLMFGAALAASKAALPPLVGQAAAASRDVLATVVADGVRQNRFAAAPGDDDGLSILALSAWATVHGLTMLIIDGLSDVEPSPSLPERVGRALLDGIRKR